MLPWIVGAVVVATLSSVLSEREKKEKTREKESYRSNTTSIVIVFRKKVRNSMEKNKKYSFRKLKMSRRSSKKRESNSLMY